MSCKWTFSKRVKRTRKPEYQAVNRHRWRDVKHRSTASICIMDPIIPSTNDPVIHSLFLCQKQLGNVKNLARVVQQKHKSKNDRSVTNKNFQWYNSSMSTLTSSPKHRLLEELLGPWNENNRNKFRALSLQSQAPGHGWYWAGNVGNCRTTSCRVSMGKLVASSISNRTGRVSRC